MALMNNLGRKFNEHNRICVCVINPCLFLFTLLLNTTRLCFVFRPGIENFTPTAVLPELVIASWINLNNVRSHPLDRNSSHIPADAFLTNHCNLSANNKVSFCNTRFTACSEYFYSLCSTKALEQIKWWSKTKSEWNFVQLTWFFFLFKSQIKNKHRTSTCTHVLRYLSSRCPPDSKMDSPLTKTCYTFDGKIPMHVCQDATSVLCRGQKATTTEVKLFLVSWK